MIDFLMDAFSVMATLVKTFVVPAFEVIGAILPGIALGLTIYAGLLIAQNALLIKKMVMDTISMALQALQNAPMLLLALAIGSVVMLFKKLYEGGWTLGTALEAIKDNMYSVLVLGFKELIIKILSFLPQKLGGYSKEEEEAAKAGIAAERKELKDRETARDAKRKQVRKERDTDEKDLDEKKRIAAEKNKIDYASGPEALLKQFSAKEGGTIEMGVKKQEFGKDKAAAEKQLDEAKTTAEKKAAIAKIEEAEKKIAALDKALALAKQKPPAAPASPSVPSSKQEAAKKGEGTKKELEAKGEAKSAADEKAAAEKVKAEEKAKADKEKEGKTKPATQESAESLLASLNTKMEQLIKINKGTHDVNERQLSVQRGLTSDLFAA
jgi:hypothetical protein